MLESLIIYCEYIVLKFVKQTSDFIKGAIEVECLVLINHKGQLL